MVIWVVLSMIFVYIYVLHVQQVLPQYQWDIHKVCEAYVKALAEEKRL